MTKRFSRVLVWLICLFVFPLLVNADVGMPEIKPYDVVVTNKAGVKLVDSYNDKSIVIPYDTKLTVNMEYYNSEMKGYYGYVEYQGISGEISLSDVRMASDKVDLKDFDKLDTPLEVYAIDDIEMYKGPSKMYGRVDGDKKIPKGSTISYEYYDEVWAYVKYDGVEGWIVIYPFGSAIDIDLKTSVASFAPKGKNKVLLTENVTELNVNPNTDEVISVNIPKETVLEYEYSFDSLKSKYLYVDYEGTKGWLLITYYNGPYSADGVVERECESGLVISDNIYVYSKRGDLTSKTEKKISKGSEVSIIYSYYLEEASWYYVSYNGENVWIAVNLINENKYDLVENYGVFYTYKTKEDIEVYEFPDKDSKKVSTLKRDADVDVYYDYRSYNTDYNNYDSWSYIKVDDVKGWVLTEKIELLNSKPKQMCEIINNRVPDNTDNKDDKNENNENSKKSLTLAEMAIIGVAGAVVLALVTVVMIAIVNKKKRMKE